MFETTTYDGDRTKQYEMLNKQLDALLAGETNQVANLSNASALLGQFLERTNWVGFYLTDTAQNELVLGPFQGLPACVRIPFGRGVCGTAAQDQITQLVMDVHAFPGHIACDAATNSEIVVPLVQNGVTIGVLDIDSPELNRFDETDQAGLEAFCKTLLRHI
ncbi:MULTISPECIES: GAF domain-containing protein [Exiguobacterium]|uniref:GAF domain-containing protein n=1 Tax=Exiguobacterium antarcticum TaxID=132920 RepID=A0ABT6QXG8_9BACL|nr:MULTISPECIES: GAF domain-containing protein [Exiguobacterium]MCT4781175.1 GAF domain-containing protein [Exiguobacterium soli]MDI3233393.1 GAF domain-containing protein [Exiguobacterium antarcticum]